MNRLLDNRIIAVVTDAFSPFHNEVLRGLQPHFAEAGFGTLGIAGRDVRTDRLIEAGGGEGLETAFGTGLGVCGAVVVSGATPPTMSDEAIARYIAQLTDGPVLSLGVRLPGVASVVIAWEDSIVQLMDHAIARPGAERVAFIRGFPDDPHSLLRERGYRAAMDRAGLAVDERLVLNGNYSIADARNAVALVLDMSGDIDVVIAANDDMAVGAAAAIQASGRRIPADVSLCGFDDSVRAMMIEPPLTTVELDTARLTRTTAELMIEALTTGVRPDPSLVRQVPSTVILRRSTDRPDPGQGAADRTTSGAWRRHLEAAWEIQRPPGGVDHEQLLDRVVDALDSDHPSILTAFDRAIQGVGHRSDLRPVVWLRHAWRELQRLVVDADFGPEQKRRVLGQLSMIDRRLDEVEQRHEVELIARRQLHERLLLALASVSTQEELWPVLRRGLHSLGITNAWVAVDSERRHRASGRSMELVFSLASAQVSNSERFDAFGLLPERLQPALRHLAHVVVPLRAGDSDVGYMVVEQRGQHLLGLEAIASGVAQVLRHVQQVRHLEAQTKQLMLANESLDRLAKHDALTGLANRKLLLERLNEELVSAGEGDGQIAILFIDLDGFKEINDTHGHGAGDQLLRIIASRLLDIIGSSDTLARLGGDEFTILVAGDDAAGRAFEIASEALRRAAKSAVLVSGVEVAVSASVGLASHPIDGRSADELLSNADKAMYKAKRLGKNRFEAYANGARSSS